MLKKMHTTKMSADKEKPQNCFSKNGKALKRTAMALLAVIIVSIICVSVWVAVNKTENTAMRSDIKLTYNGQLLEFSSEPYVLNASNSAGYTDKEMVFFPLDALCRKLGAECEINSNEAVIKVPGAHDTYKIELGKNEIFYEPMISGDGGSTAIRETKFSPVAKNSTLYIPYEFVEYIFIDANNYDVFGSILYKNEKLQVQFEIPMHWLGKYTVDEAPANENYIAFKHKGIAEKHNGSGTLFSVMKISASELEAYAETNVGKIVYQNQEYAYFIERPTDVQVPIWEGTDKEDDVFTDEYEKMFRGIAHIEDTFSIIRD